MIFILLNTELALMATLGSHLVYVPCERMCALLLGLNLGPHSCSPGLTELKKQSPLFFISIQGLAKFLRLASNL